MGRLILYFICSLYCGHISAQSDSLYAPSKSYFLSFDINNKNINDTTYKEPLFYVRQCYSKNQDFSNILSSIAGIKPYTLIYKVIFRKMNDKNIITFVQCESCNDIICELQNNKKMHVNGCLVINNAVFYIFNMLEDNSVIDRLINKIDSYNVIMKINYPEEDAFFVYNTGIPIYIEDQGHIIEYKEHSNDD